MKPLQISLENAKALLIKMPELAEGIYVTYPELKPKKVINCWDNLEKIEGYYIMNNSNIGTVEHRATTINHKNVFATEQQAKSALAYAQLTQLMKATGDCDVDWSNNLTKKYYIELNGTKSLQVNYSSLTRQFLAFKTKEIAEEFMQKHESLIKQFFQI